MVTTQAQSTTPNHSDIKNYMLRERSLAAGRQRTDSKNRKRKIITLSTDVGMYVDDGASQQQAELQAQEDLRAAEAEDDAQQSAAELQAQEDLRAAEAEDDARQSASDGEAPNSDKRNLSPEQQAQAKADMEAYKQRALAQIAKKKSKLEQELADLEKNLTDFKNGQALRMLGIFHPGIEMLIDTIIDEIKKMAKKMSKEARIKFYEKMIPKLDTLLAMLKVLKMAAAFLDAAFLDKASCLRLVIFTFATIIIPIILIIISPLYIIFLAIIIYVNKVPLMRGMLTKQVEYLTVKVENQKKSWKNELEKLTRDVTIKKQIAKLEEAAQQVQSGQISYKGGGAN